jgi:PEP-CTERM motif
LEFGMKTILYGVLFATLPVSASAATITLNFGSLPTAQGWTYIAGGDGAAVTESGAYSIVGGELHQDTLGIGMTTGGGNYYQHAVTLGASEGWSMTMVARLNSFESVLSPAYPFALFMGGGGGIAVGFGSNNVQALGDAGLALYGLPGGFDPLAYNTYRFTASGGGLQSFSINGTSIYSNQAFLGGNPGFIEFGDGTGFANANAEVRAFEFASNGVPEPASWAMMIAGFGLVGGAMRKRKMTIAYA